jgi:septum formation protein
MNLILASKSERRKQLLAEMGLTFRTVSAETVELTSGFHRSIALANAVIKARAVAADYPQDIVLGADTVIEYENRVIGKPADLADAFAILKSFSGKPHYVVTGICLINRSRSIECIFAESTKVYFRQLDDTTIAGYLDKVHVLDKAGAYAIQEFGGMIVEKIEGPLDNVVGLPCDKLKAALKACGYANFPD